LTALPEATRKRVLELLYHCPTLPQPLLDALAELLRTLGALDDENRGFALEVRDRHHLNHQSQVKQDPIQQKKYFLPQFLRRRRRSPLTVCGHMAVCVRVVCACQVLYHRRQLMTPSVYLTLLLSLLQPSDTPTAKSGQCGRKMKDMSSRR
jgi:hypothetical protein